MTIERNPENTRLKILQAAFQEIHKKGFQGMRVDQVLKNTGLKKGALYHHFSSKQTLGYAVLEELVQPHITELWIKPLQEFDDPLIGIGTLFDKLGETWSDEFFSWGCPLNNLAQEMSPIDEGYRERIEIFFQYWQAALSDALKKGQEQGIVDGSVNTDGSALFILCAIEGTLGMTKNQQNKEVFYSCGMELKHYLNGLKANKI